MIRLKLQIKIMSREGSDEDTTYPPWNFSWVVPNELAVMAHPRNYENMKWLEDEGIRHLITLSPERKPPLDAGTKMQWSEIPVEEFEAPTNRQIIQFIELCQRSQIKNEVRIIHESIYR